MVRLPALVGFGGLVLAACGQGGDATSSNSSSALATEGASSNSAVGVGTTTTAQSSTNGAASQSSPTGSSNTGSSLIGTSSPAGSSSTNGQSTSGASATNGSSSASGSSLASGSSSSGASGATGLGCAGGSAVAFPGAVGFGAAATGGRGSPAYYVTNLNDSGAGSLRDAVSAGNRIIVFSVGGAIQLSSALSVSGNLTIAGQTAPGGGIAIQAAETSFSNSSNVIVRNVRFREGTDDAATGKSSVAADSSMSIILDHVSIEFGKWDNFDINSGSGGTIQRSIIADPIGQQFNAHATSGNLTWYETIWSSAHNRNPLAKGDTQFINNVVYNFQAGYTAGDSSGVFTHDIVNNYFISGPSTSNSGDAFFQMNNQSVYSSGNLLDSNADGTLNGTAMGAPGGTKALAAAWAPTTTALSTASAADAYAYVVAHAGARPRDDVDATVVADLTSLGKAGQLWTTQAATNLANGGYGTLAAGTAPVDTDMDGIPDAWETSHGLNPQSAADAIEQTLCPGYTNLEVYINQLADSLE
ncbi:MAG: pectate lyase [Polyangiaceae bacterium]